MASISQDSAFLDLSFVLQSTLAARSDRQYPAKAVNLVLRRAANSDHDALEILKFQGDRVIGAVLSSYLALPPPISYATQSALVVLLVQTLDCGAGFSSPAEGLPDHPFTTIIGAMARDRAKGLAIVEKWVWQELGDVIEAVLETAATLAEEADEIVDGGVEPETLADLGELQRQQLGFSYGICPTEMDRLLELSGMTLDDVAPASGEDLHPLSQLVNAISLDDNHTPPVLCNEEEIQPLSQLVSQLVLDDDAPPPLGRTTTSTAIKRIHDLNDNPRAPKHPRLAS